MVAVDLYQKLARLLELYLLKRENNQLPLSGYSLIGLMPVVPDYSSDYQTLLLSSPALSLNSRWDVTYDLLAFLQKGLSQEQYQEIYNIDFLEPDSSAVQRLKDWEPARTDDAFSVPISVIGGVSSQYLTIIRSSVLQHLAYYRPLKMHLVDGQVIEGKLIDIEEFADDSILHFESDKGEQTCSFLNIARVQA